MQATKANVTKILVNAGFQMSEDGHTGRKFRTARGTRSLGTSSEGFRIEVITLPTTGERQAYVRYVFDTFGYPTERDYARRAECMEAALKLLAEKFTIQQDKAGTYLTQKGR